VSGPTPKNVNGLIGAYATAFLLTISNPATVLSFVAIYAGWQIESLSGHYFAAAFLSGGVFLGSSLWWIALFLGMTTFRDRFSLRVMWWVHRISGAAIATFGIIVLLSLSPLKNAFGVPF
jgi:threonine/homoserine/homoserine lactone efflux protein